MALNVNSINTLQDSNKRLANVRRAGMPRKNTVRQLGVYY